MNWKIGFTMWWKGLVVFAICCVLVFPIGIFVFFTALFISCPAILFYAMWLWVCKQAGFSHTATLVSTIFIPASASIICAMWLFHHFIDNETPYHFSIYGFDFLAPLLCCILSVFLSSKGVLLYLQPSETIPEFSID